MKPTQDIYLDAGMRGFIVNTAKREYWRVAELCDLSDLIQDGYVCYYKCRNKYIEPRKDLTGSKEDRKWFQGLVKTTFTNHIHSLAAKHKGVSVKALSQFAGAEETDDGALLDKLLPAQFEEATLLTLLASAPAEIKQLVQLLVSDGLSLLKFERKRTHRRLLRETTNEFYCRLLGIDAKNRNLVEELKTYFR